MMFSDVLYKCTYHVLQGDIVTLIRRVDDNWLEGRLGGRQGIFPSSYVQICREPDTPMMTPLPSLAPTPIPGTYMRT